MAFLSNTHQKCNTLPARRVSVLDLIAVHRQRRALARLDDDALADLGLTRHEAEAESRRPFWDVPAK